MDIQLTEQPIPEKLPSPGPAGAVGAWVEFRGIVRGDENGGAIVALEYEAYPDMALREMRRLLKELSVQHPCLAARILHRVGVIPVGAAAIYIGLAARHRAEGFALLGAFMDRLKVDVPIWKRRAITCLAQPTGTADGGARPLEQVLAEVRSLCQPLEPERVDLASATGRVLREAVVASEDQPAFDRSAVDGFALRVDDPAWEFRVVDRLRAGDWRPRELAAGEAVQIATGGALPGRGLQVVMKEDARDLGDRVEILRRGPAPFIRMRGEDCRAGEILAAEGTWLSPGGVGLLASLGWVRPLVARLPRVLHLATGNEIVPPEQTPLGGQIRDSNTALVRGFFAQWGMTPEQVRVPEDRAAIERALATAEGREGDPDLLLISGGASVGEHDFTRGLLEQAGFAVHVSKAATRPGKPLIVARRARTLAFGLPGNPLAHFVCLHLFVRAAVEKMLGLPERDPFAPAVLTHCLEGGGNARETLWPAAVRGEAGRMTATPLRWSSSGDLKCLAKANALLRVPPGAERLPAGTEIPFATTLISS